MGASVYQEADLGGEMSEKTEEKIDEIIEKYAKKFTGFMKKRWYIEWIIELEEFLKEIEQINTAG